MGFADLPDEFVRPDYAGGSIANVPATVAALLGAPFEGLPPLRDELWRPLAGDVRRVVLLILDAWGWNLLEQERDRLGELLGRTAVTAPITSVFPSTTVNALTCLWTGLAPVQHGLVGLRLFFPEYGVLGQMLAFSPEFIRVPDALVEAGMNPVQFLHGQSLAEQLAGSGIPTYSFKGQEIVGSNLSRMHDRGVATVRGAFTATEMLVQIRELLESAPGQPHYIVGYWPSIDTLSHRHGWDGPAVAAELHALLRALESELTGRLSPAARQGTVLLVLADHGQVNTPQDQQIRLRQHPTLVGELFMRPAGEPRAAYLYARQGRDGALLEYLTSRLDEAIVAGRAAEALASGLLGPPPHAPGAVERLGDVVATMRHGHVLLGPDEEERAQRMNGRHGSLTAAEMEVPWLALRLDD